MDHGEAPTLVIGGIRFQVQICRRDGDLELFLLAVPAVRRARGDDVHALHGCGSEKRVVEDAGAAIESKRAAQLQPVQRSLQSERTMFRLSCSLKGHEGDVGIVLFPVNELEG